MIKKRNIKNQNLRKKQDDAVDDASQTSTTTTTTATPKNDDDANEQQQTIVKRASVTPNKQFHASTKKNFAAASPPSFVANDSPSMFQYRSAGEYTMEKLDELKKNVEFLPSEMVAPKPVEQVVDAMQIDDDENAKQQADIPDSFVIRQAKERRQRAREEQDKDEEQQDFIPLNAKKSLLIAEPKKNESRLVREEDEEAPSEEDEPFEDYKSGKIKFGSANTTTAAQMKQAIKEAQEEEDTDMSNAQEEMDPELRDWELQQMKKVLPKAAEQQMHQHQEEEEDKKAAQKLKSVIEKYNKNDAERAALTFEYLEKNMKTTIFQLETDYKLQQTLLERLNTDVSHCENMIKSLSDDFNLVHNDYSFFQSMKLYVEDLIDCLDSKVPMIEQAEDKLMYLRENYYNKVFQNWCERSSQDFTMALNNVARINTKVIAFNGWSEFEEDVQDLIPFEEQQAEIDELLRDCDAIFEDTREDFYSLNDIACKFEEWKTSHPDSYRDTYCGICVQRVFAPLVRYELLKLWKNPLQCDIRLRDMAWVERLSRYGKDILLPVGEGEPDPDTVLVPEMIKKVALPIIQQCFAAVYNPTSHMSSMRANELLQDVAFLLNDDSECHAIIADLKQTLQMKCQVAAKSFFVPVLQASQQNAAQFALHVAHRLIVFIKNMHQYWMPQFNQAQYKSLVLDLLLKSKLVSLMAGVTAQKEQNHKQMALAQVYQMFPEWVPLMRALLESR